MTRKDDEIAATTGVGSTIRDPMRRRFLRANVPPLSGASWLWGVAPPLTDSAPGILLQAVIVPGDKTSEGQIIEAVSAPWFEIIELIHRDSNAVYELGWRKWEEIIAGAYRQLGFDVILTPPSNDKGIDIIATRKDFGEIRYFDQVKAYRPGHLVGAAEVREFVGALNLRSNVSKGFITTTADFAPGVLKDPEIKRLMPYRLELRAKQDLLDWLQLAYKRSSD